MNLEQINQFINKGQAAALLLAIVFVLLLIYHRLSTKIPRK